ncbi:MAG: ABC transporter permease [Syntrophales bacterium]|nr:ABC transporter permease [Syntrophales bacterium]
MRKGIFHVWQRNLTVYRHNWKVSFLPPILEPLLYLAAFGVGFGVLVGRVNYEGTGISYAAFIAPALIAFNIMNNAFFENTYGSFVRMYYQKTFDAMMATPLTVNEIIIGEIVWGATKSVIATIIMMIVISLLGFISYPEGLLIVPLALLGGLAFGSIGMYFTSIIRYIDLFNLPYFLFITPMFLFSGTFFPMENLPSWAQKLALALPLTHLVRLTRDLCYGHVGLFMLWPLAYCLVFTAIFFYLSVKGMKKRLIK